ncbi:hypothetical protein [Stigmatella aurantiaca]|uniref:Uncharacterized protein n=1 Tax=Stigmatella aurantiaca (strain DW4/3-1) TaxID=378806 RepID=Q098P8_STIAD|nr:hypothetical protein [Stigmatella aurantiaca]EAU68217.1 hypothetical protein STIAU_7747 [Stigmatella aurantiaca DW4/3-1]
MHAKKRAPEAADIRSSDPKSTPRPVGMQTMGPMLYEQIRRTVVELEVQMKLVTER